MKLEKADEAVGPSYLRRPWHFGGALEPASASENDQDDHDADIMAYFEVQNIL